MNQIYFLSFLTYHARATVRCSPICFAVGTSDCLSHHTWGMFWICFAVGEGPATVAGKFIRQEKIFCANRDKPNDQGNSRCSNKAGRDNGVQTRIRTIYS